MRRYLEGMVEWLASIRLRHDPMPIILARLNNANACSSLAHSALFSLPNPLDSYSLPFSLNAVPDLSAGRHFHCRALSAGFCSHLAVATSLVRMYSLFGRLSDARKLFDETPSPRDAALWNAMAAAYAKAGDADGAWNILREMPVRNLISWTCVLSGFARAKRPREAAMVFRRMQLENVEPDEVAVLALLSACAHLGSLESGKRIHGYILKRGFSKKLRLNNALIDMYAKSGSIALARDVFELIKERSVVTYTAMIAGLALHGLGGDAAEMFSQMENASVKPNDVTFVSLLSACSHAGLVEMGRGYFNDMASRYGLRPRIEHYGCMVDLLGRAGRLSEARELVREMPFEANAAIWGSLLAASNIHGDAELGKRALQHLVVLEPRNSGNYMILSNIYASLGGWDESGMLRKVMRDTGVKKTTGGSFVEVNNRVHRFVAGDMSNSEFLVAFETVREIFNHLKMAKDTQMEMIEFLELHD